MCKMSAWGNLLSLSKSGRTKKIVTLWFIGGTRTQADKKYVCSKFPIFDPPPLDFFVPVCFKRTPYPSVHLLSELPPPPLEKRSTNFMNF